MKPIIFSQEKTKNGYLYEQLYETIRNDILSGDIKTGERLPSLRSLSRDLGISMTTAGEAYNQLLVEGYILSRPQSGYYAAPIKSPNSDISENTLETIAFDQLEKNAYISDPSCFDFVKWKKCSSRILTDYSEQLLFESDPQGEEMLRNEISKYVFRSRGVNASPSRIVIGAGTQQLTSHLSRILMKMDINLVSIEEPGYLPVQSTLRDAGMSVYHIPVKKDGIEIEKLPTNIGSAVYVSPSNQFPTGAVMPAGRRYELLNWASENNSYIIEDDYDSELRYFGKPLPALQGLDKNQRVVYLGSFSSTLFPAIKISYMVLPEKMTTIFNEIKHRYTQTCSKAEQLTLALFMESGHYYTGIRKLRALYSQKLDRALEAFSKYFGENVFPVDTKSGISLTIKVKSQLTADELCQRAKELGLQMVPVSEITDQETSALAFYYTRIPIMNIDEIIENLSRNWGVR